MIQSELFNTIRELCESALYLYSIQKVGQAHRLLDKCEQILASHGLLNEDDRRSWAEAAAQQSTSHDAFLN